MRSACAGVAYLTAAVREQPADVTRRVRLASSLRVLDRHGEALAVLGEGLALAPGAPGLLAERAAVLLRSGQFDAAESAIAALARQCPGHRRLPQFRGQLTAERGDHPKAAAIYAAAVRRRPLDVTCRVRLASSLRVLDRHDEALAVLGEGLALLPDAAGFMVERIAVLLRSGRLDAAESAIAALAGRHPCHPRLAQFQQELADALSDYQAAPGFLADPQDVARRLRVANSLQHSGLPSDALAQIGEPPLATDAERLARMKALMQLGRWNDLAAAIDEWSPDSPRGETTRVRVKMQLALLSLDFAGASSGAHWLLARYPQDVEAANALASASALAFDAEGAWSALLNVPVPPAGGGRPRRGAGRLRTIVGQIVNELRLRPEATRVLAKTSGSSGREQAKKAAVVLRRDGGNFGAALALLIGLARAGNLGGRIDARPSKRLIPRRLHQYWDHDPPADVRALMDETRDVNPAYGYRRWNDATARRYLAALDRPGALRAYREARHAAVRADIFRLAVLFAEGGVYLDADDRCAGPVETLLPRGASAVFRQENIGSIGNNFLAAAPGHPLIGAALDGATQAVLEGAREMTWLATGPGVVSRVVAGAIACEPGLCLPRGVHVVPLRVFLGTIQAGRRVGYKRGPRNWLHAA